MEIFLALILILIVIYFTAKKISGKKIKLDDHVRSVELQSNKDKNELFGNSISDALIGFTLNCYKKSQKDVKEYFTNLKGVEITLKEFKGSLMGQFSNGCILSISIDFDEAYSIAIYLNEDPSVEDTENLKLFALAHKEYVFDNNFDAILNRPKIAFTERINKLKE